jgi:hypothetical protein
MCAKRIYELIFFDYKCWLNYIKRTCPKICCIRILPNKFRITIVAENFCIKNTVLGKMPKNLSIKKFNVKKVPNFRKKNKNFIAKNYLKILQSIKVTKISYHKSKYLKIFRSKNTQQIIKFNLNIPQTKIAKISHLKKQYKIPKEIKTPILTKEITKTTHRSKSNQNLLTKAAKGSAE